MASITLARIIRVLGNVAQWERDIISERTKDALAHKKGERQVYSPLPLGYDVDSEGRLIENETELAIVRKIRALRASGLSYQKIADRLNGAGITAKRGRWYPASVRYVFNNALYG